MLDRFPLLQTERLNLVEIKQAHLGDIFRLFSDEQVTRFYNVATLNKAEEAQKYVDWFCSRFKEKAGIRWGIAVKGEDRIIGTIGFNNFTKKHRANLGYDLQSEYWNRGYATEAIKAVTAFGFKELEVNRIEAEVMQGNTQSESVLLKSGFTKEGILRAWMYWDNKHYDMSMFSLLQSDVLGHR
ncbi:ribosomal-protein-alanine N-acetyltransferase [Cnuella takakiae]|uniref:Ribosomal-protein-alanine N-acetyltransferase n=1 Tax=Cnuella takakiae TaxID=1302690 RepID=A0A1M4WW40_9BACT|nr:GNAT family N-acetyltransferase [Cnuella takakiae]OLY91602.1 GNAT family N-acetyltransferase [Cnuella takakiae]SHE85446.1 ribosomal-protein-alanine N-acetyltransferase [Cnuella takakiae]